MGCCLVRQIDQREVAELVVELDVVVVLALAHVAGRPPGGWNESELGSAERARAEGPTLRTLTVQRHEHDSTRLLLALCSTLRVASIRVGGRATVWGSVTFSERPAG